MNSDELFQAISNIDDRNIESAIKYRRTKSSVSLKKRFSILAASLAIIIGSSVFVMKPWELKQKEEHLSSGAQENENNVIDWASQYPYVNYKGRIFSYTGKHAKNDEIGDYLINKSVMKTTEDFADQIPCLLYTCKGSKNEQTIIVKIYEEYYLYSILGEN